MQLFGAGKDERRPEAVFGVVQVRMLVRGREGSEEVAHSVSVRPFLGVSYVVRLAMGPRSSHIAKVKVNQKLSGR